MITRASRFAFTALVAVVVLLAAVGSPFAQRGPVKIGLLVPLTGPLSANGKEMANGLALYLEEQRQQLAGRDTRSSSRSPGCPSSGRTAPRSF